MEDMAEWFANEKDGSSLIHFAASEGHKEIIEKLIEEGADLNVLNNQKKTALHLAVDQWKHDIVQLLVENGAKMNLMDIDDKMAIDYTWSPNDNWKIIEKQMDKEVNEQEALTQDTSGIFCGDRIVINPNYLKSKLQRASELGYLPIVQKLIKSGVNVNEKDSENRTSLHMAALKGHKKVVQALIDFSHPKFLFLPGCDISMSV